MSKIQEYLLQEAQRHYASAANPVVAMDAIAGKSRAERLEKIAEEVRFFNFDDASAISHLITMRDGIGINTQSSMSLVFSMSEKQWFDGIVDKVSRELVGWIEVSGSGYDGKRNLNLPAYRRMLGINHDVAYLARSRNESDASWMERRAKWLAQYHPEVKVVHQRKHWTGKIGEEKEISFGTVGSFSKVEHLVEANLITIRGIDMGNGLQYEMLEAFTKPDANGAIGRIRQVAGAMQPVGVIQMRDYQLEVVV